MRVVDDIIKDMKKNPLTWVSFADSAIKKENLELSCYGNSRVLSVIHLFINEHDTPIGYSDRWNLEVAMKKWFKQAPLENYT